MGVGRNVSIPLGNKGNQKCNGDLLITQVGSGAQNLHVLWDSGICAPSSVWSFDPCLFSCKNQKVKLEGVQDW